MAFSGHKTLTEVQRYTTDVDRKRLADAAMAKLRDQSKNADYTNTASHLHKQASKALKLKESPNDMALPRGLEPLFSP